MGTPFPAIWLGGPLRQQPEGSITRGISGERTVEGSIRLRATLCRHHEQVKLKSLTWTA